MNMSKNKLIILRVQSSEGTKRVEVEPSDTTCQLFERVHDAFQLNSYGFSLYKEKNHKDEIHSSKSRTLRATGLRHGDMLYLAPVNGAVLFASTSDGTYTNNTPSGEPPMADAVPTTSQQRPSSVTASVIKEDDVDIQLWKLDGKIQRSRDDKLCRHNSNGCCVHCSPLEPYDEEYLKQKDVKHLSFHAFLRKSMSGASGGKFVSGALTEAQCRIKPGCKDHPPWPKAICSKCQPSALTLNRQVYRHVDNVMFENAALVEQFLNYWRVTGHQRIGILYGNYEIHADVPLGIRARVAAIYEPPQESTRDSIILLPDEREQIVDQIAEELGLRKVGWIFTDLIADDIQKGTVKCVRGAESHFLSAQECIMAAYFQNQNPNPCRYASNGYFGSKFVTVCVTGDKTNQVHMEGYAVSTQCMALVRDDCLLPTKDAPELGFIRESSDKQYVPDVYYKEKDSYGNEVSRLARPLPVEYLLVDVPASTPLTPQYTFNADPEKQSFPIENRMVDGHIQDFNALSTYLSQFTPDQFLQAMSDFHLLLYIATMDMLPMRDSMGPLLTAVRERDADKAREWAHSDHWATVEQLIAATNTSPINSRPASVATGGLSSFAAGLAGAAASAALAAGVQPTGGASGSGGALWTCPHCTFINQPDLNTCDMCSLPR